MQSTVEEAEFQSSANLGAPAAIAESDWVVLKFGGSSVASLANWQTIAGIVRNRLRAGLRPVIVHSAIAGVSNTLERIVQQALAGNPDVDLAGRRTPCACCRAGP